MRYMYFGTKRKMRWVKTDAPGRDQSTNGYSDRLDYLNGGVATRRSTSGHQEYSLTWNVMTREEARAITDYAHGIYGDGYIYFVDPAAADQNILNPAWSAPGIGAKDGVPLAGLVRPKRINNPDLSWDFPVNMARYDLTSTDPRRTFYIPMPPDSAVIIGAHGDAASTLGIQVQPMVAGVNVGPPEVMSIAGVNTDQRFTHIFVPGADQGGLEISVEPGTGFATLAGIMAQVVPIGLIPSPAPGPGYGLDGYGVGPYGGIIPGPAIPLFLNGGFILGQGTSGCSFDGIPRATPYRLAARTERVGLTVKLIEEEDYA